VETLTEIGKGLDEKGVLFCSSDLSLLVVSKHRKKLEPFFQFVLPPDEVIETLMNKGLIAEFSEKHGFAVPRAIRTNSREEAEWVVDQLCFPCIIKPEIRDSFWCRHVPEKVLLAATKEECERLFNRYPIADRPIIMQEWIKGGDEDVYFCLTYIDREGEPLAVFTGRKLRQHPHLTGLTSVAESYWEPFVAEEGVRFLKAAGCTGICGVEFKFCQTEKRFKITEPTVGRTDLQGAVSTKAGIDIPYIAYLDAIGEGEKQDGFAREGVKWINEALEIYAVRERMRRGWIDIWGLAASYRGARSYALFDLADPSPFVRFLGGTVKGRIRRMLDPKRRTEAGENGVC